VIVITNSDAADLLYLLIYLFGVYKHEIAPIKRIVTSLSKK